MAVTYGFYNALNHDRLYDAIQMSSIFDGIIRDGIFSTIGTAMIVTAPEDGMFVDVGPGRAWFNHTWTLNDTEYPVEAEAAEVVLDRIDAVVLEVNANPEVRANSIKFVKGTPSSSPVKPTMIHNAEVNQYALAYVTIRAGQTTIFQADIENVIGTDETPFVTGLLQQVSVEQLLLQWNDDFYRYFAAFQSHNNAEFNTWMEAKVAEYNAWYAAMELEGAHDLEVFDTWFQHMKDQLDEDAAGHLQAEIDELAEACEKGSVFTVTTEETELVGRSCVVSQGSDTVIKTFDANGVAEFPSMPYIGSIHVEATDGDNVAQGEMNIPYFGRYSMEIAFWAAVFNISTSADGLIGRPITITKGGVVVGTTSFNASGRATYKVHEPGTYLVSSSTAGGDEYATTVVVTEETAYAVNLGIPSGETATPTDDIQTWLKCASIYDKSYTLLADVLDDYYTCERLFSDSNACDYMARSSSWAAIVCTDAGVMEQIFKYSYCVEKLLGNPIWFSTLTSVDEYFYKIFDFVNTPLTGNSSPSGYSAASNSAATLSSQQAWCAFDGGTTNAWYSAAFGNPNNSGWVYYGFPEPTVITGWEMINQGGHVNYGGTLSYTLQGMNPGGQWIDLDVMSVPQSGSNKQSFENETAYTYYRIVVPSANYRYNDSYYYNCVPEAKFYAHTAPEVSTDLIHSAAYDTIYYYDANSVERQLCVTDENGIGTVDWSELEPGIYTFYSSIAKNPDNLTEEYSRTVKITRTTTEIYLMPASTLYWYGNLCEELSGGIDKSVWGAYGTQFDAVENPSNLYMASTDNNSCGYYYKNDVDMTKYKRITGIFDENTEGNPEYPSNMFCTETSKLIGTTSMVAKDGFIRDGGISIPGMTTKGQFNVFNTKRRYEFAITKTGGNHLAIGRNHSTSITLAGVYMDDERSITLYSAANDTIYYLGENNAHIPIAKTDRLGMASVDFGLLPQGTYTLYSSIAYDTDDIANATPFTKTITIDPSFKGPIIMMPNDGEGVLYWYGVNVANLAYENVARANQYYTVVPYEMRANSIYVDATRGMTQSYAVTSNPVSKGTHTKLRFHTDANSIALCYANGKAYNSAGPSAATGYGTLMAPEIDLSGYDNYYIRIGVGNGNPSGSTQAYYYGNTYAIFFED